MPELVRPIRPIGRLEGVPPAARGLSTARSPRSCTRTARRRASWAGPPPGTSGCRRSSTRSTECRSAPFETPLKNRLYIALERWAARRCHAIVSVCDAMTAAGPGRRRRPARAVPDRLQRHGRRRVSRSAASARGRSARARAGRRRGRLRHGRAALRAQGARRHHRGRRRRARGEPQGPVRLDRRRHPAGPADRRARAAGHSRLVHPHRPGAAGPHSRAARVPSTP